MISFFNERRRVHTTSYRGTEFILDQLQITKKQFMLSTSTYSSDEEDLSEVSIPTLLILTRLQQRRFIDEQKKIIRTLISESYSEQVVYYTCFGSSTIHDDALESILGVQSVIREIIFDQRSRTVFGFYSRLLPDGTFILLRGERDDIPEGPPQYDSDGNEIDTNEEID
jgi:hypothetical protein